MVEGSPSFTLLPFIYFGKSTMIGTDQMTLSPSTARSMLELMEASPPPPLSLMRRVLRHDRKKA